MRCAQLIAPHRFELIETAAPAPQPGERELLVELLETYRELGSGLTDLYLSSVSNRMSEVMKVLTVISTIFIPLTFIAGIYGMNFDPKVSPLNMPELKWFFGYPFALLLMLGVAGVILFFFKKKGWIWQPSDLPTKRRAPTEQLGVGPGRNKRADSEAD